MSKSVTVSIVICNYNTEDLLRQTIKSVMTSFKSINKEIIVVDDNSSDKSVQMIRAQFPKVRLFENKQNIGYSKSCNIGTRAARGRYILQLNSDVTFTDKANLAELLDYMDRNRKVGIAGCKLLELNGKLDLTCKHSFPTISNIFYQSVGLTKLFPKSKIFGDYYLTYLDENKIHEVDCLGAFMLLKREVIETVGLMDEEYFIYGEDIDYCYRTQKAGWKLIYYPKIVGIHHHGATTKRQKVKNVVRFHRAMYLYYKKHLAPNKPLPLNLVVYLGILGRLAFFGTFHFMKNILKKPV